MSEFNKEILDRQENENGEVRKDLLPTYIKVFMWIFLVMGAFIPLVFLGGLLGMSFNISLYGLESYEPLSIIGILLLLLFSLKGITAYGLWKETDWAITAAKADGIIGLIMCVGIMIIPVFITFENSFDITFNLRLELLAIIPYLNKMYAIEYEWADRIPSA